MEIHGSPITPHWCTNSTLVRQKNHTGISMCLNLEVTLLASTTHKQFFLSYQCTVGAPVWSDRDSMYLQITLVFLKDLYMHLTYPSVELEAISG